MGKLYSRDEYIPVSNVTTPRPVVSEESYVSLEEISDSLDNDFIQLDKNIKYHRSLNTIYNHISIEDNSLTKENYILYKEYLKVVNTNLGISNTKNISLESLDDSPLKYTIALEGMLDSLFTTVKKIFKAIFKKIGDFFKHYFVRVERVKVKLANLETTLNKTKTNLKTASISNVPGSLARKYPVNGTINDNIVGEYLDNAISMATGLDKVISTSNAFISQMVIVDKSQIDKLNELQRQIGKKEVEKENNPTTGLGNRAKELFGMDELSKMKREAKGQTEDINDLTEGHGDTENESEQEEDSNKEYGHFLKAVEASLNVVKGKPLVNGKVINEITLKPDEGVEIDTGVDKSKPFDVTLGDKGVLIQMVKKSRAAIKNTEHYIELTNKINNTVSKKLVEVEKVVGAIDNSSDPKKLNKYSKLLVNKIKVKLNLTKDFFSTYNKVNKFTLSAVLDSAEGVVDYSMVSLAHYG